MHTWQPLPNTDRTGAVSAASSCRRNLPFFGDGWYGPRITEAQSNSSLNPEDVGLAKICAK
jgi:hypothetical protein